MKKSAPLLLLEDDRWLASDTRHLDFHIVPRETTSSALRG